jgi:hypothetical protein
LLGPMAEIVMPASITYYAAKERPLIGGDKRTSNGRRPG